MCSVGDTERDELVMEHVAVSTLCEHNSLEVGRTVTCNSSRDDLIARYAAQIVCLRIIPS